MPWHTPSFNLDAFTPIDGCVIKLIGCAVHAAKPGCGAPALSSSDASSLAQNNDLSRQRGGGTTWRWAWRHGTCGSGPLRWRPRETAVRQNGYVAAWPQAVVIRMAKSGQTRLLPSGRVGCGQRGKA